MADRPRRRLAPGARVDLEQLVEAGTARTRAAARRMSATRFRMWVLATGWTPTQRSSR
ncbi:hypothetical protein HH310_12380 [Actinoplanes sp. TBRC 11911]|uniref:hypothetical protein n=1 Tax=Actinoplanes sp. TBRC 11911 TaxID=2729386 RepID=UPI00145DC959|nr:hypothetical protein [Actinoplanes sp. TBRC 11911]NMO51990.1 hypothetical protein [Actinoplanes sp. TBRC 11911]